MKRNILILVLTCIFFLAATTVSLAATLQAGDACTPAGGTLQIPIYAISSVDDATGLAGAAFTVDFDDTIITNANITSDFFETFETQLTSVDPNHAGPFEADGYNKPLVDNVVSGTGVSVAAARVGEKAIDSTAPGTVIFYLNGTISQDAEVGDTYDIKIVPTSLDNTNAGYDASGEEIDLLIGADATIIDPSAAGAYPTLLSVANHDTESSKGTLEICPDGPQTTLDIDGNQTENVLADGLLIIRYMLGNTGSDLVDGAVESDATRNTAAEVEAYLALAQNDGLMDVDDNGIENVLADGLLIIRYMLGNRGNALIEGAVGQGANRSTAAEIEAFLATFNL